MMYIIDQKNCREYTTFNISLSLHFSEILSWVELCLFLYSLFKSTNKKFDFVKLSASGGIFCDPPINVEKYKKKTVQIIKFRRWRNQLKNSTHIKYSASRGKNNLFF